MAAKLLSSLLHHSPVEAALTLGTLRELPTARHATKLAITALPSSRRERQATYSHLEVYKFVENIAGSLREAGVRPGTVIAVVCPPCLEAVCFLFALHWIGAVGAPLPPGVGAPQLAAALTALSARAVVSLEADDDDREDHPTWGKVAAAAESAGVLDWHLSRSTNKGVALAVHNRFAGDGAAWKGGSGDFTIDPDEVAMRYVTGLDGGDGDVEGTITDPSTLPPEASVVPLSHAAVVGAAKTVSDAYGLGLSQTTVLLHPMASVQALLVLVATLYSGGHVVLPSPALTEAARRGAPLTDLAAIVRNNEVDWLAAPLRVAAGLVDVTPDAPRLRLVRVDGTAGGDDAGGAAAVPPELPATLLGAPVLPAWGPVEAAGVGAFISPDAGGGGGVGGSVGPPAPGVQVAVVAPPETDGGALRRVRPGEIGILLVRGRSVASGRLGSGGGITAGLLGTEPLTLAEADQADSEGWMATADRGRVDPATGAVVLASAASVAAARETAAREAAAASAAAAASKADRDRRAAAMVRARVAAEAQEREKAHSAAREAELSAASAKAAAAAAAAAAAGAVGGGATALHGKELLVVDSEEEEEDEDDDEDDDSTSMSSAAGTTLRRQLEASGGIDAATAAAILERLEDVERNHLALEAELTQRHNAEVADLRRRLADAQAASAAAAAAAVAAAAAAAERPPPPPTPVETPPPVSNMPTMPLLMDVEVEAIEACALSAAASAADAHKHTQAAVTAARVIADAAYGVEVDADGNLTLQNPPRSPYGGPRSRDGRGGSGSRSSRGIGAHPSGGNGAAAAGSVLTDAASGDQAGLVKHIPISLDQVEGALTSHPAVAAARAFGVADAATGIPDVHVAFVTRRGARVSEPWLRLHMQSILPAAMVPRRFYWVDRLDGCSRDDLARARGLRDMGSYGGVNAVTGGGVAGGGGGRAIGGVEPVKAIMAG
ncbi:hypothetical protein MMPV_002220 [Pyropia vietnamensis]